jgi:hypothetical protein
VEDLGGHIIVPEDHRVPPALQCQDGINVVGEHGPLHGGDDRLDPVIQRRRAGDCVCVGHPGSPYAPSEHLSCLY